MLNPPFGTSFNEGIDLDFVRAAAALSRGPVYLIHKAAAVRRLRRSLAEFELAQLDAFDFPIPRTEFDGADMQKWRRQKYGAQARKAPRHYHKEDWVGVECVLLRLTKRAAAPPA